MKPSVDGYVVGELLGSGSYGRVYAGIRKLPNGNAFPVALKFIRPLVGRLGQERLSREVELGLRIGGNHPGVLTVFDLVDAKPALCLVTERIFGMSLAEVVAYSANNRHAISSHIVRGIFAQALDALAYCHHAGVLHRDISPSNVMLDRVHGRTCLIDRGLATRFERLTCTFTPEGNAPYAPLEQLRHQRLDASADLYSLGATIYRPVADSTPTSFAKSPRTMTARRCSASTGTAPTCSSAV